MRVIIAAFVLLIALQAYANEPSKLDSFAFEGVKLSTTVSEFKRQKPTAVPVQSEAGNGQQCYAVLETPSSSGAFFYFLDSKLFKVQVSYDAEKIIKLGGVLKAHEKITAAFGEPDDVQRDEGAIRLTWKKPSRDARFIIKSDGQAALQVTNTDSEATLNERRSKGTTLGF